jgi:hypothetical protein
LPANQGAQAVQTVPGRLRVPYGQALCCDSSAVQRVGQVRTCAPGAAALRLYLSEDQAGT